MRPADVRPRRLEFLERAAGGVELAQAAAEDGVDETGLGAEPAAFCQFDGGMDGGVIWNAVQPEELVEAQAQEILQAGFLGPAGGSAGDQPVQRGLPANRAEQELAAEGAVQP
jgi:hypothetical protein